MSLDLTICILGVAKSCGAFYKVPWPDPRLQFAMHRICYLGGLTACIVGYASDATAAGVPDAQILAPWQTHCGQLYIPSTPTSACVSVWRV